MKTVLYVMRHGETTHNRDGIASGHVDPDLTEKGIEQAAAFRDKLAHIHFDVAYSSDLRRAVNTAAIVYGEEVPEHRQLHEAGQREAGECQQLQVGL